MDKVIPFEMEAVTVAVIEALREELGEKNKQIGEKDTQIRHLHVMLQSSQDRLAVAQEKILGLLPANAKYLSENYGDS